MHYIHQNAPVQAYGDDSRRRYIHNIVQTSRQYLRGLIGSIICTEAGCREASGARSPLKQSAPWGLAVAERGFRACNRGSQRANFLTGSAGNVPARPPSSKPAETVTEVVALSGRILPYTHQQSHGHIWPCGFLCVCVRE